MPGIYFNVLERKTDSQQMLWLFHTDLKEICILQKLTQPEPLFSSPLKFFLSPHLPEELKKTYQFWGENICRTGTGNEILQADGKHTPVCSQFCHFVLQDHIYGEVVPIFIVSCVLQYTKFLFYRREQKYICKPLLISLKRRQGLGSFGAPCSRPFPSWKDQMRSWQWVHRAAHTELILGTSRVQYKAVIYSDCFPFSQQYAPTI